MATTWRAATEAGGADTWSAVAALEPSTLSLVGATATEALMGAEAMSRALTETETLDTGWALTNACCGTTITAPWTLRLAYVMFVMLVVLWMMVVL